MVISNQWLLAEKKLFARTCWRRNQINGPWVSTPTILTRYQPQKFSSQSTLKSWNERARYRSWGEARNAEILRCFSGPLLDSKFKLNGCKSKQMRSFCFEGGHLQALHKVSISGTASMKSQHYNLLNLAVPTGPTVSLLFTPLFMLFPNVHPESVLCPEVITVTVQSVSHTVHIQAILRTGLSPRHSPRMVCKRHRTAGVLLPQTGSHCIPTTCFLGSARPSVENCTTSTHSVPIWSIFKYLLNVKWANGLQCPAWNVDNHYFHLFKLFFLLEITSYGICNFVFEVSGKISHSFIDIFAKSIIIEG